MCSMEQRGYVAMQKLAWMLEMYAELTSKDLKSTAADRG